MAIQFKIINHVALITLDAQPLNNALPIMVWRIVCTTSVKPLQEKESPK